MTKIVTYVTVFLGFQKRKCVEGTSRTWVGYCLKGCASPPLLSVGAPGVALPSPRWTIKGGALSHSVICRVFCELWIHVLSFFLCDFIKLHEVCINKNNMYLKKYIPVIFVGNILSPFFGEGSYANNFFLFVLHTFLDWTKDYFSKKFSGMWFNSILSPLIWAFLLYIKWFLTLIF